MRGWILLIAFVAACASEPPLDDRPIADHALTVADGPKTIDELKQRISSIMKREEIAGTGIALVGRDGPIWVGGLGVRDRAANAPMTGDTVFRIGSLSKSVVALGVMRLVDQGKLDVDRPLNDYMPGIVDNPWEREAPVTLAQCMEHTAGLDDVRFNEIFADDEDVTVAATLAINPRSRIIRWRPGTRHAYSNVGYTIAARAIEVASGEPFDVYLRREVLAPMGIDADFRRTSATESRLAVGYQDGRAVPFQPFAHRPSASLLASASDLGKLVQFWIRRGEGYGIVSPAGLARIERSGTLPYPHIDSEYGFAIYGDVQHPVFARGHDGGMPGFHAVFRYFPSLDAGYVMLINSNYTFRGYSEIRSLLYAYLARGTSIAAPAVAEPERPGAKYFELAARRNAVFGFIDHAIGGWYIEDRGTSVRVEEPGEGSYDLVPAGDGGYRTRWECGSSHRFTTNRDGTPVMVQSYTYGEGASGAWASLRRFLIMVAMFLLRLVPMWVIIRVFDRLVFRRRTLPSSMIVWTSLAWLCCCISPLLLGHAFEAGVIGRVHALTLALSAVSIMFALASWSSLVNAIRWWYRPDRPMLIHTFFPMLCAVAFSGLALWLAWNGVIGLRTWSW